MTLAQMATLLLEPRARYVGRHRAPEATRLAAAVVAAPRTLVSAVTSPPAATAPRAAD